MKVSHVMAAGVVGLLAFAVCSQAQGRDRQGPPGPPRSPQVGPQFNAPMPMPPPWVRGQNVPPPMAMRMRMMQNRGPQGPTPRWGMGRGMQMPRQPGQAPWMPRMGRPPMPQGAPFGRWAQPQANRPMQRPQEMRGCPCECPRCHMKFRAPATPRGPMPGPSPRPLQRQQPRRGDPRVDVRRERQPNPARAERAQQASRAQGRPSCAGCPGGSCGKQGSCGQVKKPDRPAAGGCPMAGGCGKKDAKDPAVKKAPAGGCGSCGQGAAMVEKPRVKAPPPPVKKQREAIKEKQPKVLKEKQPGAPKEKKPDRSV